MTRQELYQLLEKGPVFLDGATGTMLQEAGLPVGVCPEKWIMEHPDVIRNLQRAYVEAGTQILYAPTFTATGLSSRSTAFRINLWRLTALWSDYPERPLETGLWWPEI